MLFRAVGSAVYVAVLPIALFFGYEEPHFVPAQATIPTHATSSSPVASTTTSSTTSASTTPPVAKQPTPVPTTPVPIKVPPLPTTPVVPPPPPQTQPPISTTTEVRTVGTTTLAIGRIPLLAGGIVHAGATVPIAYLQMTNIGSEGTVLKGFWVKQYGSAPAESVIGLTTVDDKALIRAVVGGTEGATPFQGGSALAPTDAYFAPGQMRLFTIKAVMTQNVLPYIGMTLMIDVTGIETAAATRDPFPIRGTTWTIAQ